MNAPVKLRLQFVTTRQNADGSLRYYFQQRGRPVVRLPDDPLSPEFMERYQRCLEARPDGQAVAEGTFGWLCDQYMDSADFKAKAPATRAARRRIILSMTIERLDPAFPETFAIERIVNIGRRHLEVLRDRKGGQPNAANERLKILGRIFRLAVARGWLEHNPARDVERLSVRSSGHRPATDADIEAYFAKHSSGPAWLAMVILTETGVRVSDLRILGRQHIRKGSLAFDTVKTGVRVSQPVSARLRAAVADCAGLAFLARADGRPYASDKALSQRVAKWFRQAGISSVTAHGVRKWAAIRMAESGATEWELCSWFGWRDPKEARPYVQAANRKLMAKSAAGKLAKANASSAR